MIGPDKRSAKRSQIDAAWEKEGIERNPAFKDAPRVYREFAREVFNRGYLQASPPAKARDEIPTLLTHEPVDFRDTPSSLARPDSALLVKRLRAPRATGNYGLSVDLLDEAADFIESQKAPSVAGRNEILDEAINRLGQEYVSAEGTDGRLGEDDEAYNAAVGYCIGALRAMQGDYTPAAKAMPDSPRRWRVKAHGDDLITYWKSKPPHSNEYAAAEIIEELERELASATAMPDWLADQVERINTYREEAVNGAPRIHFDVLAFTWWPSIYERLKAPSASALKEITCPACKGSGDVKSMTSGRGPDDEQVDVQCEMCGGVGAIASPNETSSKEILDTPPTSAKQQFDELLVGDTTPLERLRFFCSLAMEGQDWMDVEPFFDAIASNATVPMLLWCPRCEHQHIDAPEPASGWTNPPHATHTCKNCGLNWRPCNENTMGMRELPAKEMKHIERMAAADPRCYTPSARAMPDSLPPTQHRYAAPFKLVGDKTEWVQVRFVPRAHIHDKPTEANPSPIRVIVMHELEAAQPHALAFNHPVDITALTKEKS